MALCLNLLYLMPINRMVLLNIAYKQFLMEYNVLWLLNIGLMQFKQLSMFETLFSSYDDQKKF